MAGDEFNSGNGEVDGRKWWVDDDSSLLGCERKSPPFDKLRAGFFAQTTREKWGTRRTTTKEKILREIAGVVHRLVVDFHDHVSRTQARLFGEKDLSAAPESGRLFKESASRMSTPLISFGQTLGVLTLHSSQRNAFRESELQLLEAVADICANSIQNAHYVERVKQLAYLDGLTGIFNRRFFELRIMEEIERARRYGTGMAVIMADIDQFKRLNDEFGHLLGDEVLRQVSSLFHQQLRKIDVVCRYGGEEFAILLTQTNAAQAIAIAEKLRRLVEGFQFPG